MGKALILHTTDRLPYTTMYDLWHQQFKKHWKAKGFKYYFMNEDLIAPFFKQIKTGEGQWTDRLRIGLEQIPEGIIFYIQEDAIFHTDINVDDYCFDGMNALRFALAPLAATIIKEGDYYRYNDRSEYLMDHRPTLWRKSFLLEQLGYNEDPWVNEFAATRRMWGNDNKIYTVNKAFTINSIRHGKVMKDRIRKNL